MTGWVLDLFADYFNGICLQTISMVDWEFKSLGTVGFNMVTSNLCSTLGRYLSSWHMCIFFKKDLPDVVRALKQMVVHFFVVSPLTVCSTPGYMKLAYSLKAQKTLNFDWHFMKENYDLRNFYCNAHCVNSVKVQSPMLYYLWRFYERKNWKYISMLLNTFSFITSDIISGAVHCCISCRCN